jgi:hypothetical protein
MANVYLEVMKQVQKTYNFQSSRKCARLYPFLILIYYNCCGKLKAHTTGTILASVKEITLIKKSDIYFFKSNSEGRLRTKLYDKRDDFNIPIVTTNGTYPLSFLTQIFHSGQPCHGGDQKTFEVMTLT